MLINQFINSMTVLLHNVLYGCSRPPLSPSPPSPSRRGRDKLLTPRSDREPHRTGLPRHQPVISRSACPSWVSVRLRFAIAGNGATWNSGRYSRVRHQGSISKMRFDSCCSNHDPNKNKARVCHKALESHHKQPFSN